MEAQSQVLWDFLRLSYQRGLMDDLLALGDLMDPNMDFVDALEAFEDAVTAMDLNPLSAMWRDQLQPMIKSMTNTEVIDALRALLQAARPLLAKLTAGDGQAALRRNLGTVVALKPHLAVLLRQLGPSTGPMAQKFVRENAGRLMGNGLNAMSEAILDSHARDPYLVGQVFSDLFRNLDTNRLGRAMEIVVGGLLDQRPKVVRWTLGTALARIRKRFARS